MRILLTGASGFIGKNLKEGLTKEYKILAPFHKELDILDYNRVEEYIKNKKIDVIIHSAIKGGDQVLEMTMRMFLSIVRNVDKVDKIIHLGSGAEYGKTRNLIKIKETDFGGFIPLDNFGLGKYLCSKLTGQNKRIINLRLFGVYGKYEDYRYTFISNSIANNLFGLSIKIRQDAIFDYLYINDLMPIIKFFVNNPATYSEYNIGPTESISLKRIAEIINKISQKKSKIVIKNKGLNFQYSADNTRLLKLIPGIEFTTYEKGIKELYDYHVKNINNLDKDVIMQDDFFHQGRINKYKT